MCAREGFVVDVIYRVGVELLQYFLYDVGCVLMHAGGVGGACFFVVDLSGGEMRFKVTPCFICIWFLIPFSMASAKIRALLRMVFPMLISCGSVSGVPWASSNVVYLCILLKMFATGSSWMYWCWSKAARSS